MIAGEAKLATSVLLKTAFILRQSVGPALYK